MSIPIRCSQGTLRVAYTLPRASRLSAYHVSGYKASPWISVVPQQSLSQPAIPLKAGKRHSSTMSSSPYPSRDEIHKLFNNMASGNYDAFYERVSPNVDWTVLGTHPCAGRYKTLKEFQEGTLVRLGKIMKKPGLNLAVRNVIGGGDAEWATVELVANAECLNGEPMFDMSHLRSADDLQASNSTIAMHGAVASIRAERLSSFVRISTAGWCGKRS